LVVVDNSVNLEVASKILEKAGCEVVIAQNGQAAIDFTAKESFELIFMDIQMPSMNGMSATRRIKRLLGKLTPPVVAMTAFTLQEERDEFLAAGMDDFISKPIKAQELIGMVKKWTEGEAKATRVSHSPISSTDQAIQTPSSTTEIPTTSQQVIAALNVPVVNVETAMQLKKYGGEEILTAVYGEFDAETTTLLLNFKQAIEHNNQPEMLSILHTIKGNAGTLGIEQVANQAAFMEVKLKKQDDTALAVDFANLDDYFKQFQQAYREILDLP